MLIACHTKSQALTTRPPGHKLTAVSPVQKIRLYTDSNLDNEIERPNDYSLGCFANWWMTVHFLLFANLWFSFCDHNCKYGSNFTKTTALAKPKRSVHTSRTRNNWRELLDSAIMSTGKRNGVIIDASNNTLIYKQLHRTAATRANESAEAITKRRRSNAHRWVNKYVSTILTLTHCTYI